MVFSKNFACLILLYLWGIIPVYSQVFQESGREISTEPGSINWQQFPDFELPFTVVFHGEVPVDGIAYPLRKGFSHIAGPTIDYLDTIYPAQRVFTYTGIPNSLGWGHEGEQPWKLIKSPWGNDVQTYREKWAEELRLIKKSHYKYQPPAGQPFFDMAIADIEWHLKWPNTILSIKSEELVPEEYREMRDADFIQAYQMAMANLYGEVLELMRDSLHKDVYLSSYSDVPVIRVYDHINLLLETTWLQNPVVTNYLMHDSTGQFKSNFYEHLEFLSPSIYNFYPVADEHPLSRKYLAYNLFQIEANAAWSEKPQLVFCWMNYHYCCSEGEAIEAWMAEATAIFPLMAGVEGLYPWLPLEPFGYETYEYFIHGLYRMSQFNDFFDGNETPVIPESAYDSYVKNLPVWRGVLNGNRLLVAAQNPHAQEGDTTIVSIEHQGWSQEIGLVGNQVFLEAFDLPVANLEDEKPSSPVSIYPNPVKEVLQLNAESPMLQFRILDIKGMVREVTDIYSTSLSLDVRHLSAGHYVLELTTKNGVVYEKFVKE